MIQGTLFNGEYDTGPEQFDRNNSISLFALASMRGVGFATIKCLCDEFKGDLTRTFKASESDLVSLLYDARTPNPTGVARAVVENPRELIADGRRLWGKYQSRGINLVFRNQAGYPNSLLDLASPPSWLFVEGDVQLLQSPFLVGFVGTRAPTTGGLTTGRRAASCLAQQSCVIVSGLAEGIDAIGHQSALLFGSPTIAVLGHGIDVVFPASTAKTRQDIVLFGGAIVSEYLPWDNYSGDKFVNRNRIQAALSRAICFVEAREKSGTAHTLRFARHLNRKVFGVTMGGLRGVPEEELLKVIGSFGDPIFDVSREADVVSLSELIHEAFTQNPSPGEQRAPQMFRNIAQEVRRLAHEYGASKGDLNWLKKEIGRIPAADLKQIGEVERQSMEPDSAD